VVCPLHTGFVVHGQPYLESGLKLKVLLVEIPGCERIPSRKLLDESFSEFTPPLDFGR
jgi:hypothetical protein